MPQSYLSVFVHCIFSTKDRLRQIDATIRPELHAYIGGIARTVGTTAMNVNGTEDHVHMLLALTADASIAEVMRVVKANSSKWVHDRWPALREFAWQRGYGAFSVSESKVEVVKAYITRQEEHHRLVTFQEEFIEFLRRHKVEYDPRYIWA